MSGMTHQVTRSSKTVTVWLHSGRRSEKRARALAEDVLNEGETLELTSRSSNAYVYNVH